MLSFWREEVEVAASMERESMRRHTQRAGLPRRWGHMAGARGSGEPRGSLDPKRILPWSSRVPGWAARFPDASGIPVGPYTC